MTTRGFARVNGAPYFIRYDADREAEWFRVAFARGAKTPAAFAKIASEAYEYKDWMTKMPEKEVKKFAMGPFCEAIWDVDLATKKAKRIA